MKLNYRNSEFNGFKLFSWPKNVIRFYMTVTFPLALNDGQSTSFYPKSRMNLAVSDSSHWNPVA